MSLAQSLNKEGGKNSERVRQAIEKLQELPASAAVLLKALDATEDPLCTNDRLQEVLSADPGATADVLRLANSAYFGVSSLIRNLAMAVTVIGHKRLRILLRHLMVNKLWEKLLIDGSVGIRVRTTALAAGVACHELGKGSRRQDSEELLIGGLLHNVGEQALLSEFPRDYEKVVAFEATMAKRAAELAVLGVDSSTVSRWLLEAWHFPEILVNAAVHWSAPEHSSLSPSSRSFVTVVHVGVRLAQAWIEGTEKSIAMDRVSRVAASLPRYRSDTLLDLYDRIGAGVEKLQQTCGPPDTGARR